MADRNSLQKHVWRARIVLLTAEGHGTCEIMRRTAKSKTAVWRWQERFMQAGADGLLRDKTRPSRIRPLGPEIPEPVVALTTTTDPPGEATHWTAGAMAKAVGISVSSVQRIWRALGLQPHRVRRFKLSRDPQFAAKLRDITGLYDDPPAQAVVLSVDEKSQIQALDRTPPGLPLKPGRAGTMTHIMLGMDGNELVLWLAKQRCTARVIIITGYTPDYATHAKIIAEFKGLGPVTTLYKPIESAGCEPSWDRTKPLDARPRKPRVLPRGGG